MRTGVTSNALLGAPKPHWLWALAMLRGMLPIRDWVQAFLITSASHCGTGHEHSWMDSTPTLLWPSSTETPFHVPTVFYANLCEPGKDWGCRKAESCMQCMFECAASDGFIETAALYTRSMIWGIKKNLTAEVYQITNIFSQYREKKPFFLPNSKAFHWPIVVN